MIRREFLRNMLGLAAAAGIPACRRSEESVYSYVTEPEGLIPGVARHYATTIAQLDSAFGVIVESHEAHPTKIEGNPKHPESGGATTAQLQAALFDLYDPERSHGPMERGVARSWVDAERMLDAIRAELLKDGGASFAVLVDPHRSLTLSGQLASLRKSLPQAKIVRYAPLDTVEAREATQLVYGRALETNVHWGSVDCALLLDADPFGLEGSPIAATAAWSKARCSGATELSRLYVVESTLSLTGSVADHRWPLESHQIPGLIARLATLLVERGALSLSPQLVFQLAKLGARLDQARWAKRLGLLADEFVARPGRTLIHAGPRQPTAIQALVHLLNDGLGNIGTTLGFVEAFGAGDAGPQSLKRLVDDVVAGRIKTLLVLGSNPVYTAPGDIDLRTALLKAEMSIHVGNHCDETARLCRWHLNLAHDLESWSDAVARDGTTSIVQPVTLPLWGGKTAAEVVARLAGSPMPAYDLVRATWRGRFGATDFESRWRKALLDGITTEVPAKVELSRPDFSAVATRIAADGDSAIQGLEVVFTADANLHDGRFGNNAWLHELPHPITKSVWGNSAFISQELANERGIRDGQVIQLTVAGRSVGVPTMVVAGQAPNTIALSVGQGHSSIGKNGNGVGVNVFPLRTSERRWVAELEALKVTPGLLAIARTQVQFDQLERRLAREKAMYSAQDFATGAEQDRSVPPAASNCPQAWGMAIDLNRCNGCQSCVIACQAENNVPSVGRDAILRGRSMHWLRVDRYYRTEGETLRSIVQPVPCQQCERAPCESVCPVGATAHSPEGLNDMVYNRCVGSRYCANNCPFEVRRFNYFEHNAGLVDIERLRMNPDVTVRSRGVMEKCTFCVQRIQHARIDAKKRGMRRIDDGEVIPACAQACPAHAITFGDLTDRESAVSRQRRSPRAYRMLEELNIEPRVFYLARVRNPNPNV